MHWCTSGAKNDSIITQEILPAPHILPCARTLTPTPTTPSASKYFPNHSLTRSPVGTCATALCAVRRVAARAAEKASPKLDINKLDINEITATLAEKWDETENKSTVVTYVAGGVVGA